ncbi:MAG: M23 family metallopeptidase [Ruminococcaceae bacterium]|nr:M23 family metallopeptidase [Oscillospiraceae bacterium]
MKNKIIITIVVLLCFIPTLAAVLSYRQVQNAPIDENTAVAITIKDINQKEYVLTRETDGEEAEALIKFFLTMKKNSQAIPALPTSLTGEKCYVVTVSSNVKKESYECYFSQDPATNYFVSNNGTAHKISEEDAKQFITSVYAESLYDDSTIPTLLLSHEYYVTPDSAIWQYKNYTGDYVDRNVDELINPVMESFEIEGGLDLAFSHNPDYCTVKVTDAKNGSVLFEDILSNLSLFRLDNTKEVEVTVTAKWYDDPGRSFCGELGFSFGSLVTAPAEFYLGMTTVESGKFTAITALNVTRPEKIEFVSTLPNGVTPKFFDAGDNRAVALLPINADCPSGIYTLTFSYGGVTQNTNLTIENPGPKYSYYTVPASVVSVYRTTAALEQFENATQEIMAKSVTTRHFSGHFILGVTGNYQLMRGFGRDVYLNNSTTVTYRNNGVDYTAAAGSDIVACNAGEVVYVGILDYAGNIVVIDHGWGLKTWYYNLGSVTATVGDVVTRGQKIGTAGQTGFTGAVGAHIAMSVGNQFVSPYDTWSDSPIAGKVIIAKIDER